MTRARKLRFEPARLALLVFVLIQVAVQLAPAATIDCAGADLSKLARAVYVSPQGNDSGSCGGQPGSACKSIQQGIKNCQGEACGVLVRYGVYSVAPPVELTDGVSVYGSCVFDETDYKYRSMILGRPAVRANNINKPTTLYGFVVLGTAAPSAAEASIAMVVSNSKGLTLSHDVLTSGRGGDGSNGRSVYGLSGGRGSAASGDKGGEGGKACPSNPPSGSIGEGGRGADFQQLNSYLCAVLCRCDNNNFPASLGKDGEKSGEVAGGSGGGRGGGGCMCDPNNGDAKDGPPGDPGKPGACASAGGKPNPNNKGAFNGTAWVPSRGDAGALGQVGSGGGGGGSGGYGVNKPTFGSPTDFPGRPGGGGGGGGCGGPGGQGAEQGGASIPVVLFNSSIRGLGNANAFIPGPGGRGGNGATGGKGGPGGEGFPGQTGPKYRVHAFLACEGRIPGYGGKGGNGGQGGAGAGGAGGNGGPSFGIALVNSPPVSASDLAIYPAQPGAAGSRGSGGQNEASQCKGADGEPGLTGFSDNNNSVVSFTSLAQSNCGKDKQ